MFAINGVNLFWRFGICLLISLSCINCVKNKYGSTTHDVESSQEIRYPIHAGPGFVLVNKAEDALLKSVKETGNIFGNTVFWNFMDQYPDLARSHLHNWYNSMQTLPESELSQYIDKLGKHFPLLLDPGILLHIERFLQFYSSMNSSSQSSAQVRKSFSDSLIGESRETYRGMVIEEHVIDIIKKKGLVARVFISDEKTINVKLIDMLLGKQTYQSVASSSPYDDMLARLGGREGEHSVYSSFTDYIPVTHVGCWMNQYGKIRRSSDKGRFYLFKVKVNPLDLIRPERHFSKMVQNLKNSYSTFVWENGQKKEWSKSFQDIGFENFIQYVAPTDIEIIPYDEDPPVWWN